MILAGFVIALGDIVDDAIIDIENVVRRLRQQQKEGRGKSLKSMARIILEASLEVRGAIVYATLIEVLAIMPVFFMEGLSGRVLQAAGLCVCIGSSGVDGRRADGDAGIEPHSAAQCSARSRESPIVRWLQRGYAQDPGSGYSVARAPRTATVGVHRTWPAL